MPFSPAQYAEWAAGFSLEAGLFLLAVRRGLFRRLPSLAVYLLLLNLAELLRWSTIYFAGYKSPATFYSYWVAEALLLTARGGIIAEICWRSLRAYPGIWKLCRVVLVLVGASLILAAILAASRSGFYLGRPILVAQRGLELSIVGILLCGLAFSHYYRVGVDRWLAWIALGLGVYSSAQIVNNTALVESLQQLFPWWAQVRVLTFHLMLLTWVAALWRPLPRTGRAPALLASQVYDRLVPELHGRLRELNGTLSEMLK